MSLFDLLITKLEFILCYVEFKLSVFVMTKTV